MPGLDYLNEPYDPREDGNYFKSGLKQLAIDTAAPWAIKHATRGYSSYLKKSTKSLVSEYRTLSSSIGQQGPGILGGTADNISDINKGLNRLGAISNKITGNLAERREAQAFSKLASRYGKAAGIAGAVVIGWELGKGLLGVSRTFETTPEEIAARRRKPLYSGGEEYFDSRAAFTQRQRALQVIHNSQMSTRAAFSEEASFLHY